MKPLIAADGGALDRIEVTGITAHAFHGVFAHERREGQTFAADVVIYCDTRAAAARDDLAATVNYGTLGSDVHAALQGEPVDLIETLAQRIADVCLARAGVVATRVTVHKPQAPLTVPFGNVSLTIERWADTADTADTADAADTTDTPCARAVLSLGSNLGNPAAYLQSAITQLAAVPGVRAVRASSLYDSEPWGGHVLPHVTAEPPYANCVVVVDTSLAPVALLDAVQQIEANHARTREVRWGSRTLDIDIVAFEDASGTALEVATARLTLPHPHAAQRAFVLVPWLEIEPRAVLAGEPVSAQIDRLDPHTVATGVHLRDSAGFVVPAS